MHTSCSTSKGAVSAARGRYIRMGLLPGQGAHIDEEGEGVVGGCGRCWRHSGSLVSRHSWSQIRRWDWSLNNGTLQA